MLSVPFALVGGVWLLWLLGYNLSVAVAVGFIALAGVAAETGVVMLIYLEHAWQEVRDQCARQGRQPRDAVAVLAEGRGRVDLHLHRAISPDGRFGFGDDLRLLRRRPVPPDGRIKYDHSA